MAGKPNFDSAAVHGVNNFIWKKLQDDLGWKSSDYGGVAPMTTPQMQQEFNDAGAPYIIYNYRIATVGGVYGYKEEYVVYQVNSSRESDIRKALNLIDFYLGGMDESATLVNDHVHVLDLDPNPFEQFDYKSILPRGASGAAPTDQEGGLMNGSYEFAIRYTSSRHLGFIPAWP